jgi:hypothetical protein
MPLSKKDAVTLALSDCGGATDTVDTEDAAVAAYKRAPALFQWRKHHEQIDLDAVRVALRHESEAAEPRVSGSVRAGWHLTPAGVAWIAATAGEPEQDAASTSRPNIRRAETRHTGAEFARLRASVAFGAWSGGRDVSPRDAAAVFRIDHYTSDRDKTLKTQRLAELVSGDSELAAFVSAMAPLARSVARPEVMQQQPDEAAEPTNSQLAAESFPSNDVSGES